MGKIPVSDLIKVFQRMYKEHWRYTWGRAAEGDVDCSGAFVYAYRQFGKPIAHGSNSIARNAVEGLLPIGEARPGMAAFKLRKPGDAKYGLPAKFRKGGASYNGDLNDCYHIGLVDEGGKDVLNAQGERAGFTRTKIGHWDAVGYLRAVDYRKGEKTMQTMTVTSENGQPVRVRKTPSAGAGVVARLGTGTAVEAGDDVNGWRAIVFGDAGGYMMSKFLRPAEDRRADGLPRPLTAEAFSRLCAARDQARAVWEALRAMTEVD